MEMETEPLQGPQHTGTSCAKGFFFFLKIYLFMIDLQREREREREAETQEEGEASSMPGAQRGTPSWYSRITPWAKRRRQTAEPPRDPQKGL